MRPVVELPGDLASSPNQPGNTSGAQLSTHARTNRSQRRVHYRTLTLQTTYSASLVQQRAFSPGFAGMKALYCWQLRHLLFLLNDYLVLVLD